MNDELIQEALEARTVKIRVLKRQVVSFGLPWFIMRMYEFTPIQPRKALHVQVYVRDGSIHARSHAVDPSQCEKWRDPSQDPYFKLYGWNRDFQLQVYPKSEVDSDGFGYFKVGPEEYARGLRENRQIYLDHQDHARYAD